MYKVFQTHAESYKIKHIYTVEFFLNAQIFLNTHTHTLQNTSSSITHTCTNARTHTHTHTQLQSKTHTVENVNFYAQTYI